VAKLDGEQKMTGELDPALAEYVEEFTRKLEAGEHVDFEAFARDFPHWAEPLARLLPALQALANWSESVQRGSAAPSVLAGIEPVGSLLGEYRIICEVGRGGMGIVYEAVQGSLNRRVALKVLPFAAALDDKRRQRFKQEAQAAAKLHHTNIVPVFSVGCERGVHFFAMQYIEGRTLAAVIDELRNMAGPAVAPAVTKLTSEAAPLAEDAAKSIGKSDARTFPTSGTSLPAEETVHDAFTAGSTVAHGSAEFFRTSARLGMQAAEALAHAHAQEVIHRDIKPANLLVDVRGHVWVTDFGVAHMAGDAGLTLSGDLLGTLRYMSPEQALAMHDLDARSDVYSLAATLYELLALRPALDGKNRHEILRQIAFEEPRPLRQVNSAVPGELETIVAKAMAKEPAVRYATAQELADDLRRFLEDKPIRARRPGPLERARKLARRHQGVARTAAALALAVIGLGAAVFFLAQEREEVRRQREEIKHHDVSRRALIGHQYQTQLQEAHRAWQRNDLAGMVTRLLTGPDTQDWPHKSFEWRYLWRLCSRIKRRMPGAGLEPGEEGHRVVYCFAYAPQGDLLASAGSEGTIKLWNVASNKLARSFFGHAGGARCVAFAPEGRLLASGGDDGAVRRWDLESRRECAPLLGHGTAVGAVAFSPDRRWLASGAEDGEVWLWDRATGVRRATFRGHTGGIRGLAFEPGGSLLASASTDGQSLVWDVAGAAGLAPGSVQDPLSKALDTNHVSGVAFSPDGKILALACHDETLKLWDVLEQRLVSPELGCGAQPVFIAYSPDGTEIAAACANGDVILIEVSSGRRQLLGQVLVQFAAGLPTESGLRPLGLAFSSDGRRLAVASENGWMTFWDPRPVERLMLYRRPGFPGAMAFSGDGRILAAGGSDGTVRLWDVAHLWDRPEDHLHADLVLDRPDSSQARGLGGLVSTWVTSLAFGPDGRTLAAGFWNRPVRIWDWVGARPLAELPAEMRMNRYVGFGDGLLVGTGPAAPRVWDGTKVKATAGLVPPGLADVEAMAISPDGRTGAFRRVGELVLWDIGTGQRLKDVAGCAYTRGPVAFSPDGSSVVSACFDGRLRMWDVFTGEIQAEFLGHGPEAPLCLALAPDGKTLATGARDGKVRLWSTTNGAELLALDVPTGEVRALAFSPDGCRLAANVGTRWEGNDVQEVYIWIAAPERPPEWFREQANELLGRK
jgi:WD40 repeat protein/serine/threonine protein kinase